jgi:hypothetical protein
MIKNEEKSFKENLNLGNHESGIIEQGDIYFFYRPKKNSSNVKDIDDVRRFFMVTALTHQTIEVRPRIQKSFTGYL